MSNVTPTKLILINSATYDYGEVIINDSVHLVGENNYGKSSLVNALQFFLIDDFRSMKFPRDISDTLRFYFPDKYSYVLLEIFCPDGYKTLGACSKGRMATGGIERFTFDGKFCKEDFVDGKGRVRPTDEVKASLSSKQFTLLDAASLRTGLTGIGNDNKGVSFGLVPLKDRDGYRSFRYIFQNLLRLDSIRQVDIKQMFIDTCSKEISATEIDPAVLYSERHNNIQSLGSKLKMISINAPRILGLAEKNEKLKKTRKELPLLYSDILFSFRKEENETQAKLSRMAEEKKALGEEIVGVNQSFGEKIKETGDVNRELGAIDQKIKGHEQDQEFFQDFGFPIQKANLEALEEKKNRLWAKIDGANSDKSEILVAQEKSLDASIANAKTRLSEISSLVVTLLSKKYKPEDLEKIFAIYNPEILGLAIGDSGVDIHDKDALDRYLAKFLQKIKNGKYSEESLSIPIDLLAVPDLKAYSDPEVIKAKIKADEQDLVKLRERLQAARDIESLKKDHKAAEKELSECRTRMERFEKFTTAAQELPLWKASRTALEKKAESLVSETTQLKEKAELLERKSSLLGTDIQNLERGLGQTKKQIRDLLTPPGWNNSKMQDELVGETDEKDLASRVREYVSNLQQLKSGEDALSVEISKVVFDGGYGTYLQETDQGEIDTDATISLLNQEVHAIPARKETLEHAWQDLITGMGQDLKMFPKSVEAIAAKIAELNRSLAKISISNLARLQIKLNEMPIVGNIRNVTAEKLPLFVDIQNPEASLNQISEILKIGRLKLIDAFNLRFEVEKNDGTSTSYDDLDIESNGTTITIKVLINMMLIKNLLRGNKETKIPYYLDEAADVSESNLKSLLAVSKELGFVPLLAGTVPLDAARYIYFLEENSRKRITIHPHSMLEIEKQEPELVEEVA
jgi:hypothetical protein